MCLQSTLGGDLGSGHFYLAENRTFLLCVDTRVDTRVLRCKTHLISSRSMPLAGLVKSPRRLWLFAEPESSVRIVGSSQARDDPEFDRLYPATETSGSGQLAGT
jgi:hypothetical protein